MKSGLIIFAVIVAIAAPAPVYCQPQEQPQQIMAVSGSVSAVDSVGSTIVIRCVVADEVTPVEVAFSVEKDAKITEGAEVIELDDINIGDPVNAQYYRDSSGALKITRINDGNLSNNQ